MRTKRAKISEPETKKEIQQTYVKIYQKYVEELTAKYSERVDKQYKQVIREIFSKEPAFLRAVFCLDYAESSANYQLALCNLFGELNSNHQRFKNDQKYCDETLDWLADNGLEEILSKYKMPNLIQSLIIESNIYGVQWALAKYNDSQLIEILIDNNTIEIVKDGNFHDENQVLVVNLLITKLDQLADITEKTIINLVNKKAEIENIMQKETSIISQ